MKLETAKVNLILVFFLLLCSCTERQEEGLSICFTGDLLLDRGVRQEIERKKSVGYLLTDVKALFQSSNAVVVNLELPFTDTVSAINKKFIFRGEPEWLPELYSNGITHAVLANNHSIDQGREGLVSTYRHLTKAGIVAMGYGKTQQAACEPVFIKKGNIELALYSSVPLPIENWVYLENTHGICQCQSDDLCSSIKKLKQVKPDCKVIVILHWGSEFQQTPTMTQQIDARRIIDAGAEVIIGHHPHVIQEEEIYKGKPIFYSLGNFIFDQSKPYTDKGLIVNLKFTRDSLSFHKHYIKIKDCKPYPEISED